MLLLPFFDCNIWNNIVTLCASLSLTLSALYLDFHQVVLFISISKMFKLIMLSSTWCSSTSTCCYGWRPQSPTLWSVVVPQHLFGMLSRLVLDEFWLIPTMFLVCPNLGLLSSCSSSYNIAHLIVPNFFVPSAFSCGFETPIK